MPTFRVSGIGIFRIEDGRVAERWLEFDAAGLMRQLARETATEPAPN